MINFDDITRENIKEHNSNWPQIPNRLYRILIIGGSGSRKTNALLNLISHQPDIDKIYLYSNDLQKAKHQLLTLLLHATHCVGPNTNLPSNSSISKTSSSQ